MKQLIKTYTFNATAKTIVLTDFTSNGLVLERLSLIVDTTLNKILYNFADSTLATATIGGAGNKTITLSTVGTAATSDSLMVIYDCQTNDPTYDVLPVSLPSATVSTLTPPAAITNFANETGGNLAAIKTDVDKIPSRGSATSANSTPVVIASDQNVPVTPTTPVLKTYTGSLSATTDLVAASGSTLIYVCAISLVTSSATANTLTFQDNASTAVWTVPLQALTGSISGVNLAVPYPSYLFSVAAGHKLTLNFGSAQATVVSITYWQV